MELHIMFVLLFNLFALFIVVLQFEIKKNILQKQLEFVNYCKKIINEHEKEEENSSIASEDDTDNNINTHYDIDSCDSSESSFDTSDQLFPLVYAEIKSNSESELFDESKSKTHWIELIGTLIMFSVVTSQYGNMITFYASYMNDRFEIGTMISLSQISIICISDGIIGILYEYFEIISKKDKYLILIFCNLIAMILVGILFPYTNEKYINLYWLYMFVYGIVIGIANCLMEILCFQFYPDTLTHYGTINGLSFGQTYVISIFTSFFIAFFWDAENEFVWFWNIQFISISIALCVTIFLYLRRVCKKEQYTLLSL